MSHLLRISHLQRSTRIRDYFALLKRIQIIDIAGRNEASSNNAHHEQIPYLPPVSSASKSYRKKKTTISEGRCCFVVFRIRSDQNLCSLVLSGVVCIVNYFITINQDGSWNISASKFVIFSSSFCVYFLTIFSFFLEH